MTDKDKEKIISDFAKEITSKQQDMHPDFIEIVNKHFWELF